MLVELKNEQLQSEIGNDQQEKQTRPIMMNFKEAFKRSRVGGEYDPKQQIRIVRDDMDEIPYIQTKDIAGMGSTHTGERSNEH